MRLRYFYQQLLSYLLVILLTVGVVGGTALGFLKGILYNQLSQDLNQVADYVVSQKDFSSNYLSGAAPLMARWNLAVVLVDAEGERLFPEEEAGQADRQLSNESLDRLREGESLSLSKYSMSLDPDQPRPALTLVKPILDKEGGYQGYLAVGTPFSFLDAHLAKARRRIHWGMLAAVLLACLIALAASRWQTRRLNRLSQATREIASGNLSYRIPLSSRRDEFDDLAQDFNQMAQALEEYQQEVDRQEKLRSRMLMDVAHEMRTPLTTMNGLIEALANRIIPPDQQDRPIQLLQSETQRLIRLVNDNLDYEKIQAKEIYLKKICFPVQPLFEEIAMQEAERAREKGTIIQVDVAPGTTVYADRDRFRQIIFNLTQNAVQFTDQGRIELRASMTGEGTTILRIKDNGIGMSQEEVQNIWERFYKADESRKSGQYGESGLGLSIVQQLVLAHDAKIDVQSAPGLGSIFTLEFPSSGGNEGEDSGRGQPAPD